MPQELRQRGFDVRVKLFHWEAKESGRLFRSLTDEGFQVDAHHFGTSESNVRWLLESMVQDPPDLLIADNVVPGLLAGRFLRQFGIPTVGILRSDDSFYHGIIDRFVAGDSRDRLSAVVCVSQFLTDTVRQHRIESLITETIPSGTPIPEERAQVPGVVFRLVYVGRLVQEQKRILETVQAIIRVVTVIENVHVTIYGDGPERSHVEELIRPFPSKIALAGNVPSKELHQRLLEAHVIVLLSDYEGTPTAVMEAMACGVVPVCLRIRSGIPELVLDGETGILVDDRGTAFLQAIVRLKNDRKLWEILSTSARKHVEKNYSIGSCADRWAQLLRRVSRVNHQRTPIIIPRHLKLAPSHVGYAHQDSREPSIFARTASKISERIRKTRVILGRIRRDIFAARSASSQSESK